MSEGESVICSEVSVSLALVLIGIIIYVFTDSMPSNTFVVFNPIGKA